MQYPKLNDVKHRPTDSEKAEGAGTIIGTTILFCLALVLVYAVGGLLGLPD